RRSTYCIRGHGKHGEEMFRVHGYTETEGESGDSMNQTLKPHRHDLRAIARSAMIDRGLLPDFSPAVLAETDGLAESAMERDSSIRDHRGLLCVSIDNDDSRDLDQLSYAEPVAA